MNRPISSHLPEWMLHAYLDGELSPDERRTAEAHLAACTLCADELEELRGLFVALENVPGIPLARDLTPAILAELDGRHWARLARLVALELAAALLLLVLVWPTLLSRLEQLAALALPAARMLPPGERLQVLPGLWSHLPVAWPHVSWAQFVPFLWLLIPLAILWLAGNAYLLRGLPHSHRAR